MIKNKKSLVEAFTGCNKDRAVITNKTKQNHCSHVGTTSSDPIRCSKIESQLTEVGVGSGEPWETGGGGGGGLELGAGINRGTPAGGPESTLAYA